MPVGGLHEAVHGGHVVGIRVGGGGRSGAGGGCGFLERRAVSQPINLGLRYARWRRASQFRVATGFHRQRVRRRQEVLLENCIDDRHIRRRGFLIFARCGNVAGRTRETRERKTQWKEEWHSAILGTHPSRHTNVKELSQLQHIGKAERDLRRASTAECITPRSFVQTRLSVAALFAAPRSRSKSQAFHIVLS